MSSSGQSRLIVALLGAVLVALGVIIGVLVTHRGAPTPVVTAPVMETNAQDNSGPAAAAPTIPPTPAATSYEVFVDRGEPFVRAGTQEGLAKGSIVALSSADGSPAGSGSVLEVWDHLARLSLDSQAAAASGALRASFSPSSKRAGSGESGGLKGSASLSGFGPAKRLTLYNGGPNEWTGCDVRLPTNRRYWLERLRAGDQERIILPKFAQDGVPRDLPLTWVSVTCQQGAARFSLQGG